MDATTSQSVAQRSWTREELFVEADADPVVTSLDAVSLEALSVCKGWE